MKTPVYLHALSTAKDARSLPPTPNQHRGVNGVPNSFNKPQGRGKDIKGSVLEALISIGEFNT